MTTAMAEQMFHKNRKAIRAVNEAMQSGNPVTIDYLMEREGWSRTKAHSTLQTMWLLGILRRDPNHKPEGDDDSKEAGEGDGNA